MKGFRLVAFFTMFLFAFSVAAIAQEQGKEKKKNKGVVVTCVVTHYEAEKIPGVKERGLMTNFQTNTKMYIYGTEDALVQLCSGDKVIRKLKSDFEGMAFFKKVKPGDYTIKASKEGFKTQEFKLSVKEKDEKRTFFLVKE